MLLLTRGGIEMPNLTIEKTKWETLISGYVVLKDERPMAYTQNVMDARAVKVALESWWQESKKYERT